MRKVVAGEWRRPNDSMPPPKKVCKGSFREYFICPLCFSFSLWIILLLAFWFIPLQKQQNTPMHGFCIYLSEPFYYSLFIKAGTIMKKRAFCKKKKDECWLTLFQLPGKEGGRGAGAGWKSRREKGRSLWWLYWFWCSLVWLFWFWWLRCFWWLMWYLFERSAETKIEKRKRSVGGEIILWWWLWGWGTVV